MFIYCRSLLLLLAYILPDNTEESEHAQSDQASQSCDLQLTALLLRNKRKNGTARVCASACVCVWLHKPVSNHWQSCFDIRRLKCFRCWFNFFFSEKKIHKYYFKLFVLYSASLYASTQLQTLQLTEDGKNVLIVLLS